MATSLPIPIPIHLLSLLILLVCFISLQRSRGSVREGQLSENDVVMDRTVMQAFMESRHLEALSPNEFVSRQDPEQPLSEIKRALVMGQNTVRLAVFGSSDAFGYGLADRFDAYPFLVSSEVVNYADVATGPNYPSVCVNTMVGDDQDFDVIVLDYWLTGQQGLEKLALRLRGRFPHATLVFNKIWTINDFRRKPSQTSAEEQNLFQWKTSMGLENEGYEPVKQALLNDNGYWYFPEYTMADASFTAAMEASYGVQFHFPFRATAKQTVIDYLGYFDEATHTHLTERGHAAIAVCMQEIINSQPHDLIVSHDAAITWGAGDSCHLWSTTGGCMYEYSPNWGMIKYDVERGRYALHVEDTGWIKVQNSFADPRTLYLSFLATAENWYPKATVSFQDANGKQVSLELDPATTLDQNQVHLVKTVPVGKIPHGTTQVTIQPSVSTNLPFRLVGASLTNEDVTPLEFGFGELA